VTGQQATARRMEGGGAGGAALIEAGFENDVTAHERWWP
jgi:hypothetical protein